MAAQGTLMEPSTKPGDTAVPTEPGIVSVVVPVVERTDDLMGVYRAFARELEKRSEVFEFLFVFDGRFAPPAELIALSREKKGVRILRFVR
jgi:hypothetical protein